MVVVVPELKELALEITRAPKRNMIQELAPDSADQSFDERMP
jgi:hypothetical protein